MKSEFVCRSEWNFFRDFKIFVKLISVDFDNAQDVVVAVVAVDASRCYALRD